MVNDPAGQLSTPFVVLVFDRRNRVRVTERAGLRSVVAACGEGGRESAAALAQAIDCGGPLRPLAEVAGTTVYAAPAGSAEPADGRFAALDELDAPDGRLDPDSSRLLAALQPHLVRLPYLDLGENDYIFRFRTRRERNREVYLNADSEALYHSELCAAIKQARRTREKLSGEPAELDFGAVRYVLPSHFGFCLGVQNAIERAYETVATHPGRRVFMLSELIHNPFVNRDLLARGLRYLQTDKGLPMRADGGIAAGFDDPAALWNQLSEEDIVIIPAFGATNEDKLRLIRRGIDIRSNDATCMLVEKVWKAARRYSAEGYTVVIHGKAEHEETKATFSNSAARGPALIVRNLDHARELGAAIAADGGQRRRLFESAFSGLCSDGFDPVRDLERIAVVNQTTLLRNETIRIIDHLRGVIEGKHGREGLERRIWTRGKADTLCYATQVNQDALNRALTLDLDAAIVVGGRNSSNTYQLFHLCRQRCGERAYYIQSEDNILGLDRIRHYNYPYASAEPPAPLDSELPFLGAAAAGGPPRVLVTGGASCPDGIIQQVVARINSLFPAAAVRPVSAVLADWQERDFFPPDD